jgi:glutaconyl-CoA/methylmalonyl-CoA decarboxylase subunit gamma
MRKHLRISLEGKVFDVVVEDVTEERGSTYHQKSSVGMPTAPAPAAPMKRASPAPADALSENDKLAPLAGMIVEVNVKEGGNVKAGQQVLVLEAMKMKTAIGAHKDGTVTNLPVKVGDVVNSGQLLLTLS